MSGLHDGVSTVFVLRHQNGFCFDGYKSERELVERLLYRAGMWESGWSAQAQIEWIDRVANKVKEQLKHDYLEAKILGSLFDVEHIDPSERFCHASQDGDCSWKDCPQIRDAEPENTGRPCPLIQDEDDEG